MSRSVIFEDDDFQLVAQMENELTFIHCDVYNYTKSTLKKMRDVFSEFKHQFYGLGGCCIFAVTPNTKFLDKVDPSYRVIEDHEERKVIVWDLIP